MNVTSSFQPLFSRLHSNDSIGIYSRNPFSLSGLNQHKGMFDPELELVKAELSARGEPQEILPGVFLGSLSCTLDHKLARLKELHITHILSVGGDSGRSEDPEFDGKRLELRGVDDLPSYDLFQHFEECCRFIDASVASGGACLVHCFHGKSRSAAVVAAYLIHKEKCTPTEAIDRIKDKRPVADPNKGFRRQLENFYIKVCIPKDVKVFGLQ